MTGNELYEPLRGRTAPRRRNWPRYPVLGFVCVSLAAIGATLGIGGDSGRGGEPEVVGTIEHVSRPVVTAAAVPPVVQDTPPAVPAHLSAASLRDPREPVPIVGQTVEIQNGVKIYRPVVAGTPGLTVIKIPPPATVFQADAEPANAVEPLDDGKPRIALLFGGLGFDRAATSRALAELPAAVTFGFTPYGEGLATQAQAARAAGHEVVLQLPMEGFGKVETPPVHMLTVDAVRRSDDLAWLLGRFPGYAGVSNLLGGRVMANEAALRPIAEAIASQGLYFLEDGAVSRSALAPVARDVGLRSGRTDVVLDPRSGAVALTQDLARLEDLARRQGTAIGTVIAGPGTVQVLAQFLGRLPGKGIKLVGLSEALAAKRATAPSGLALSR